MAQGIPGAEVILAHDGQEAKRFTVEASGHVLVYDTDHGLLFSGGITPSREHEGRTLGLDGIESLIKEDTQLPLLQDATVYGCPLNCRCQNANQNWEL